MSSSKDDLGYLGLHRTAECFALLAEEAKAQEWSHVEYRARVIGEQAKATLNRKLAARLRFARFRSGAPWPTSTFSSNRAWIAR